MKELVIVSGKGGTGKTSISAALAFLAPQKVLADCDVDAANFHLISSAVIREIHPFTAGFEPHVDAQNCTHCGKCTGLCRFGAITAGIITTPLHCEGCGVCAFNCPEHAIAMHDKKAGQWFVSDTRLGRLIHAEPGMSVENSGKLVSKVRQEAKKIAIAHHLPLIITDGPPGIGCPAIAALSGASLVLAVVEPTLASMHDLQRLWELIRHFQLPMAVCINKSTLNSLNTHTLIAWCSKKKVPVVGNIPYSDVFNTALQAEKTVMDTNNSEVQEKILELWYNLSKLLDINPIDSIISRIFRKINSFGIKKGSEENTL
ncbi:MAG TPA: ATP-binding protein [Methylomusa anaerophila]|uniref:CobQ/CobB/MinD/ParA nucleotide binding domain protein n=1 Tax=Methylomusa anaerophila TaxID=1930071 RepID=A0A348AF02_9FIRM|nr:ATP-binding protein [Methylomusa anaerophila]BBB89650.1 CobQ/CobB/MinD/ParA nucleotide binding domain protein [Methylomusa anaerophila]HML89574.1 ATP-binding protein [Methylomusa anaerophila]